jgi:hypothetical protein
VQLKIPGQTIGANVVVVNVVNAVFTKGIVAIFGRFVSSFCDVTDVVTAGDVLVANGVEVNCEVVDDVISDGVIVTRDKLLDTDVTDDVACVVDWFGGVVTVSVGLKAEVGVTFGWVKGRVTAGLPAKMCTLFFCCCHVLSYLISKYKVTNYHIIY